MPLPVTVPRIHEQFDIDGRLADDELRRRIHTLLIAVAEPVPPSGETTALAAVASSAVHT